MFTINVEKECGCFQKSAYDNNMSFESKDDALMQARLMESHMNQKFCQKHMFTLTENGDTFSIGVEMKPKEASAGGCCGGGHCS
jgi:hypothetical protein